MSVTGPGSGLPWLSTPVSARGYKRKPPGDCRMNDTPNLPDSPSADELAALRALVEGTVRHTGQEFFQSLVRHLAAAVGTRYAFVAEFVGATRARTLAFWFRDRITDDVEWDVTGTPCEDVVR